MIIKIIFLTCWILFSILEGLNDGHFYHDRNTSINPDKENIHWIYFVQRLLFGGIIAFAYSLIFSMLSTFIFSTSLIMIFSFFHNGVYYITRNKLDKNIYKEGWWSNSNSSEAVMDINDITRTILAIIGLGGILITIFDKSL